MAGAGTLLPGTGAGHEDVLGLVLQHARSRPRALALRDQTVDLSYSDLESRARQLATGLSVLGAAPGQRVALHYKNSAAFVTLALSCLWTGAAFVPLPVDSPPVRLARVLDDCAPVLVVTEERWAVGRPGAAS